MNLHIISLIIGREYKTRVRKKSFLVTTFVVPILMAALCIVPVVLMMTSKEKTKKIAVIDRSEIVMPTLSDTETIDYVDYGNSDPDEVKAAMSTVGIDAVLTISALRASGDASLETFDAEITSLKPLGMDMSTTISRSINDALENHRIASYDIADLKTIINSVKSDVHLQSYTMDEEGKESVSEAGVYSVISMVLGLLIFLFITLFGGSVMSAVIEEKSSRVVEVLVSSVKATELMFGKIIGIALVALTQFVLWIVLTLAIVSVAGSFMGQDLLGGSSNPTELVSSMGVDAEALNTPVEGGELQTVLQTLKGVDFGEILVYFLVFFILGYMLYASLYAAIGSAVENEGDSQQLQMPVTIPLMIAYFIAIYTFNAPDSSLAFWGSIIPFTSPIVMLARLPYGVPGWEMALSIGLLLATFVFCAWLSAKIYKIGILMFGKKTTFKDLYKWLKQN